MNAAPYRWNAQQAAADYDAAAPEIHPLYDAVQQSVIESVGLDRISTPRIVDLGGGSGRLAERLLTSFPGASVTIVDPSAAFLQLAAHRLAEHSRRSRLVRSRAQDDWRARTGPIDTIVSTSALHHLDAAEKNAVFRSCFEALPPGGSLINGDEFRPPSDAAYRELLEEWGDHMESALAVGAIPDSFRGIVEAWRRRNLDDFGGPRESGDDCHETIEEQTARLYGAGFDRVRVVWRDRLWATIVARKAG